MTKLEIRKTRIRLTIIYFLILFVVLNVYAVVNSAINLNNLDILSPREEQLIFNPRAADLPPRFRNMTAEQRAIIRELIEEARVRVITTAILLQIILLSIAAGISYILSGLALRPVIKAYESQTEFIIRASHELKTPLTILQLELEALIANQNINQTQANSSLEEVERMNALVTSLITSIRAGKLSEAPKDIRPVKILIEIINRLGALANAKKVNIESKIQISQDYQIKFVSRELADLINILLENAIKYSPVDKEISVELISNSDNLFPKYKLALIIKNNLSAQITQTSKQLTENFSRGDNSFDVPGFGLGLGIAKVLADKNKARLEVSYTDKDFVVAVYFS